MASDTKTKNNNIAIIAAIGGLVMGIIIGFAVAKKSLPPTVNQAELQKTAAKQVDDSLYNEQSAISTGKVKNISATSITIFNNNGKEATFPINDKIILTKQGSNQNSVQATINDIKTEQFVIINLKKNSGNYNVYSIIVLPPIGTPPPPPTISK